MRVSTIFLLTALSVVAALTIACGDDDPVKPPVVCDLCPAVKDLSHKADVLNNTEYAYNKRRGDVYDALLDNNFTFSYAPAGGGAPIQWGRDVESVATAGLLNDQNATRIDLDLSWEDGVTWDETPAGTETWYYTTVFYHFTIKIGDTTYIPNAGSKAQFTVRNAAAPGEKEHWKLVEFTDLGGPSLLSALARTSTQPTTWGKVKSLYR